MSCFSSMLKYLVFLFNFLFFVTGCVIAGFGAFMHLKLRTYFDFSDNTYVNSAIVFIVVGVVIAFVSFFGCCGACTENSCMMYAFASFKGIILAVEIGLVITVFAFKSDAVVVVSRAMKNGLANYSPGDVKYEGVTGTWDVLQHDLQCCGVNSYKDWATTQFSNNLDVPDSCCKTEYLGCGKGALHPTDRKHPINEQGCFHKFLSWTESNIVIAGGIGVGVVLVQVVAIFVSCSLARKMSFRLNYV